MALKELLPNVDRILNLTFEDIWKANYPNDKCPMNVEDIPKEFEYRKEKILKDIFSEVGSLSALLSKGIRQMSGLNGSSQAGKAFGHLSTLRQNPDSLFHFENFLTGYAHAIAPNLDSRCERNRKVKKAIQSLYDAIAPNVDEVGLLTMGQQLTHKSLKFVYDMMKKCGVKIFGSTSSISTSRAKQKKLVTDMVDGINELPGGHGASILKLLELLFMKLAREDPNMYLVEFLVLSLCFDSTRLGSSAQSGTEQTEFAMNLIAVWNKAVDVANSMFDQETRMNSPASYISFLLLYLKDTIENIDKNLWNVYGFDLKSILKDLFVTCENGEIKKIKAGLHFYKDKDGVLNCIGGRDRTASDPNSTPDLVIEIEIDFRGDLKGFWDLMGMSGGGSQKNPDHACCLYCKVKNGERHCIFDINEVATETTVDEFCKDRSLRPDVFWLMQDVVMDGGKNNIVDTCMFDGKSLNRQDITKIRSSKTSGMLKKGQKVVVLKQDHGMSRDHEKLSDIGLTCMCLVLCMLHLKMRIVHCALKSIFFTAKKKKRISAAQSILHKSGINYKLELNDKKQLPNMTGKQYDDLMNVAMGPLLSLLLKALKP
ncbi:hypothetical protein GUITHDRAFT_145307 [Guillardia theta CCMP2712]|uniref:Uncharacterized protein n=1 Tax=Guillardia theta (strain CCMP2712) TaxID=905079 RepID=L1IME4_GUITC|nr:hypothetical protein GUITHDRAFT_145307 [Guillardia theta CCMP2712]EKX37074.1 hypothetical protein GUITHDRAFT_145307 [Guillardia theta CCMP2712]|eukprot:XP_005824054.1 hypothetical protein GUITHDRAFT_145307 [Guillardia theta CCMP2712]